MNKINKYFTKHDYSISFGAIITTPPNTETINKLTAKCKIFGCKNEPYPFLLYKSGEMHGVIGYGAATAVKNYTEISYTGCNRCKNYKEVIGEENIVEPYWICDCQTCKTLRPK